MPFPPVVHHLLLLHQVKTLFPLFLERWPANPFFNNLKMDFKTRTKFGQNVVVEAFLLSMLWVRSKSCFRSHSRERPIIGLGIFLYLKAGWKDFFLFCLLPIRVFFDDDIIGTRPSVCLCCFEWSFFSGKQLGKHLFPSDRAWSSDLCLSPLRDRTNNGKRYA